MPFSNDSDEKLFSALKQDDERALQAIIARYWEGMYKMATNTLDDLLLCEDIVQDIFIKIWNNRTTLDFSHSLRAYLFASTRYEIYRQLKRQYLQQNRFEPEELTDIERYNPHNLLEYKELLRHVEDIVDTLPARCREVYLLSREQHLAHKDIAERLNLSTKTVENQLTIALRRIRNGIGKVLFLLFF
ncbi:RNA polymerase sigma-70 factor [Sphingobacterium sp. SGG-5]|uniref:RNA polymerase sigma-70 factor n=1 Tax=Sphingobacterium sp. SGG-5 TaxID=2710881 RepID=UPI0013EE05B4|nr:RNA polymerase sigma-70 factor [Sphingobacterium sp. SGG-5]NGM61764.1 RNA polymerase sigma-70 factor [Sphingobacterium sp. SGG-5]